MKLLSVFQTRSGIFYQSFEEAAENNVKAALELLSLAKNPRNSAKIAKKIHNLEQAGDEIAHQLYEEVSKAFVPPMDREDIMFLTRALDDVIDLIHLSGNRLEVYPLKKKDETIIHFAQIILEASQLVSKALPLIRSRKNFSKVHKLVVEINNKENEADVLLKEGLRSLFKSRDIKKIIILKDIYETMEQATDSLEDIADILSSLITKYE
ncbi:MAG: DUF47 domain-containing protein [Candidatus Levyibacteriota bacterium]